MARLVKFTEKKPLKIECNDKNIFICQCGLSKKYPYCDGSHSRVKDEENNKLYIYDDEKRIELN